MFATMHVWKDLANITNIGNFILFRHTYILQFTPKKIHCSIEGAHNVKKWNFNLFVCLFFLQCLSYERLSKNYSSPPLHQVQVQSMRTLIFKWPLRIHVCLYQTTQQRVLQGKLAHSVVLIDHMLLQPMPLLRQNTFQTMPKLKTTAFPW